MVFGAKGPKTKENTKVFLCAKLYSLLGRINRSDLIVIFIRSCDADNLITAAICLFSHSYTHNIYTVCEECPDL